MLYDIAKMRAELQRHIAPLFAPGATGTSIAESFESMQASDNRLAEQTLASCLIPRDDGNGRAVVDCVLNTANSHAIQEKVLQRIATNDKGRQEVLDFMNIHTAPIAIECQGPDGEMWYKNRGTSRNSRPAGSQQDRRRPGNLLVTNATALPLSPSRMLQ